MAGNRLGCGIACRHDPEALAEVLKRFFGLAHFAAQRAARAVKQVTFRGERDGMVETGQSLLVAAHAAQRVALAHVGVRRVRLHGDGLIIGGERLLVLAHVVQNAGLAQYGGEPCGVKFGGLGVAHCGGRQFLPGFQRLADQEIGRGLLRVGLDHGVAQRDCLIMLGQLVEQIGLAEQRLFVPWVKRQGARIVAKRILLAPG